MGYYIGNSSKNSDYRSGTPPKAATSTAPKTTTTAPKTTTTTTSKTTTAPKTNPAIPGSKKKTTAVTAPKVTTPSYQASTPAYQEHINYFGSPQNYANAIQQAEAPSGRGLSDPTAAAAFKSANPQYFATAAPKVTTPSYQASTPTYQQHIEYFGSPQTYASAIQTAEASGGRGLSDPAAAAAFKAAYPQYFPAAVTDIPIQEISPLPVAPPYQSPYQQPMQDILTQIKQRLNQNYDYTTDPYYQSQVQLAEQQGQQASQQSMEELNSRGILNSTITADRVAQAMQNARTERLPGAISQANQMRQSETGNILSMLNAYAGLESQDYTRWRQADQDALTRENTIYTRQRQAEQDALAKEKTAIDQAETKLKNAWERVKNIGYVDNTASVVLGLPVNTPTLEAQKAYDTLANQLNIAKMNNDADLQQAQASNEASMQRTQVTQAGANARTQAGIQAQRELADIKNSSNTKTNQLITDLLSLGSPEEAFSYLAGENGQNAATGGADLNKAMQAIRTKYPEYFRAQQPSWEDLLSGSEENPQ